MEIWKTIPNFTDYEASNLGNIRSLKNNKISLLSLAAYSNGYLFVSIKSDTDTKAHSYLVHRLILMAFDYRDNYKELQVNHINCKRTDNRLENLEWMTPQENRDYRDKICNHTPKAQTIRVEFLDGSPSMMFNSKTECGEYFGLTRKAIDKYLQAQTVRSDRKVQARFYLVGNTYELNSNN